MEDFTGGFRYIIEVIFMRKKRLIWLVLLLAIVMLTFIGLDQRMIVRRYTVETHKLDAPIRLVVLTDYHGGNNADSLLPAVEALQSDAVLLVGDMFSADWDVEDELALFQQLSSKWPTFYVTGNHEYWEHDVPALLSRVAQTGVTVLDAARAELTVNGQRINICGIPDPYAGLNAQDALARAAEGLNSDTFTILLAHRPELIDTYAATGDFDLVIAGHAHGGQVRIPFLVNGLCAPDQGWFPKYAGGLYQVDGTTMIVSRGLSTQRQMGVPRIFNRPEILLVTSVPLDPARD